MKNLFRVGPENLVTELKKCRQLFRGKLLHEQAKAFGYEHNINIVNALISMYGRCSSIQDALKVFKTMESHNISSWNALLLAYVENGQNTLAVDTLNTLDCQPNSVTYVAALKACGCLDKETCSRKLQALHHEVVARGFDVDVYVGSTLVDVYCKCGMVNSARDVFDRMRERNVVSWSTMILGYAENGESLKALEVFDRMDCEPNHVTFVAALKACTGLVLSAGNAFERMTCLEKGVQIHQLARERALDRHIYVANALINMYSKCNDMQRAQDTFHKMSMHSIVSWNTLILGYSENGQSQLALKMFDCMNFAPDRLTIVAALKACVGMVKENFLDKRTSLDHGCYIHRLASSCGLENNILVANTLVDMYGKCGDMRCSREVFSRIASRDVVSWTALISGYVENGEYSAALEAFESMDSEPDALTYAVALKACAGLGGSARRKCLEKGKCLHSHVRERGFDRDVFVANTLVDMYSKAGDMTLAREAFNGISRRNVVSWNTLILGYVENSRYSVALEVFESMDCDPDSLTFVAAAKACTGMTAEGGRLEKETCLQKGLSIHAKAREHGFDRDTFLGNTLIDMYGKYGSMNNARQVFDGILHRTDVSWTAMILGYMDNGMNASALEAFHAMDCAPSRVSLAAALRACASMGALDVGRRIHYQICRLGIEHDDMVGNSLVNFYGKCGAMFSAEDVFDLVQSRDIVSWNALIGGYSSLRDTAKVLELVRRLQEGEQRMNEVTLLLVLNACNHAGLVEAGERYFREGVSRYGIRPSTEHYTCMVDMLSRANRVDDAVAVVGSMPLERDGKLWMSLLKSKCDSPF